MKISLRSIWNIIRNNWHLKLFSFVISIIIWFVIVQYVNPEDTRKLDNIRIEINTVDSIPIQEGLVLVTDYDKTLSITYTAGRDVIAMLNTEKIKAYVDLSGATKSGEYDFPVKIDTGGQNITIVNQTVKTATLKFEKSISAQVKVDVIADGTVAEGYMKNDPVCVPSYINVEGPESKISKIVAAEAVVPEKTFKETNVYNCEYGFVDENGETVTKDFIVADTEKVDVTVTVLKTKTIPITATIINSSGGYESNFAKLSIEPSSITIAGSDEVLETYNSYDLGTIDVADQKNDFTQNYVVSLQNGIRNVDSVSTVSVAVDFGDIRTKTIEFTAFKIENLTNEQKAEISDKSLSVTFRGVADDIAKIDISNITIVADFQDKKHSKGTSNIPVYAVIPDSYKIGVVGKYYLTVQIS